ncbi:MAG: hypothetical protein K1X54_10390 [Flavobacteriales bacterium]|nr:hypothetical protein [Flavobacteriales bacterium]
MKIIFSILFSLLAMLSWSQPGSRHGCHHYHNRDKSKYKYELTAQEKVLLNASIARSDTFDILSYTIHLDVTDVTNHMISASTTVKFRPLMENQSIIRFDLMQMTIDSVQGATGNLLYSYTDDKLTVALENIPALDDSLEITVHYHGVPYQDPVWGGFYFESGYVYNLGIGLSTIPPNFGRVWYPCFDSFVERATYEYHVKSAGTYRAHCQGSFLGETTLAGDTVIRSFAFDQAIPTHLSAVAVAAYVDHDYVHTGANGDIPVRLTAKSANMSNMQNVMQNLGEAIDACEYWYGPYAWERVGYILTTDGALEIPTNIAYPQYMVTQSIGSNNGLLAHELGHHWWGDIVTPHNHNDMWLKEGPAEYSSHLMVEWMDGQSEFIETVKNNHLDVLENAHLDDAGFWPLSPMPDEWIYGTHTYYKGASVMHNLRAYMGDELFRQGMTGVQQNYAYQDVTPEEFRDALEAESGVDLDDFFADQVFNPGFSVCVVDSFHVTQDGEQYNINLHIQQKLRECPQYYHHIPLDLTIVDANNNREDYIVDINGQFTTLNIGSNLNPAMIILNGHNRLNQARMDHEFWIGQSTSFFPNLPYVEFRVEDEVLVDSSLVRVEHIWAAPDNNDLGEGIFEISDQHYWIVDGLWNPGDHFSGRASYNGSTSDELDYDLYNGDESNAVLLYRPNSSVPWQICPDFTHVPGGLTNGDGSFNIDTLRLGQYAFANGDASVNIHQVAPTEDQNFSIYPVPTNDVLTISGHYRGHETALFDVYGMDGKMSMRSSAIVQEHYTKKLNTSELPVGPYILRVTTADGEVIGQTHFEVIR